MDLPDWAGIYKEESEGLVRGRNQRPMSARSAIIDATKTTAKTITPTFDLFQNFGIRAFSGLASAIRTTFDTSGTPTHAISAGYSV